MLNENSSSSPNGDVLAEADGNITRSKFLRIDWLGQTLASFCWIVSVFVYGYASGDGLQLSTGDWGHNFSLKEGIVSSYSIYNIIRLMACLIIANMGMAFSEIMWLSVHHLMIDWIELELVESSMGEPCENRIRCQKSIRARELGVPIQRYPRQLRFGY